MNILIYRAYWPNWTDCCRQKSSFSSKCFVTRRRNISPTNLPDLTDRAHVYRSTPTRKRRDYFDKIKFNIDLFARIYLHKESNSLLCIQVIQVLWYATKIPAGRFVSLYDRVFLAFYFVTKTIREYLLYANNSWGNFYHNCSFGRIETFNKYLKSSL